MTNAVSITFIGGEESEIGNIGFTTMGPPDNPTRFPLNEAVTLDPDKAKNGPQKQIMEQIIAKARGNRFFKVEDVGGGGKNDKDTEVEIPKDWMDLHYQTKAKLARDLGAGDDVKTSEDVEIFIEEEVDRRKKR